MSPAVHAGLASVGYADKLGADVASAVAADGAAGEAEVFVGMTAGVRTWVDEGGDPPGRRARRARLRAFLRALRAALAPRGVAVRWESPHGCMSAERESKYEHRALDYVIAHCLSPHPSLRACLARDPGVAVGHIGVGGASIQVSWRQGRGALGHRLLPFSFTTPDAVGVAEAFFRRRRRAPRAPPGVYFGLESCYWVLKEILERGGACVRGGGLAIDKCAPAAALASALACFAADEEAKPAAARSRNYITACLLRLVLEEVLDERATVVVTGQDYCGADITWPLGRLHETHTR